jgi:GT2 family glycosyltransferase
VIRDRGRGVNRARNLALCLSAGDLVVFTDDDCVPDADWLNELLSLFDKHPTLSMVAGSMTYPKGYRSNPWEICPVCEVNDEVWLADRELEDSSFIYKSCSANLALRKSAILKEVGWFDMHLGPGQKFSFCDDDDMRRRIIEKKLGIATTNKAIVRHTYGIRKRMESLKYAQRRAYALGAFLAKYRMLGRSESTLAEPRLGINPLTTAKQIIRSHFMQKGWRDCIELCSIDSERKVLIDKGANADEEYNIERILAQCEVIETS